MGGKGDKQNNPKLEGSSLSDLIDYAEDSEILSSTVSLQQHEKIKKDDDFIEIIRVWKSEKKSEQIIKNLACFVALGLMIYQIIQINIIILRIGKGIYKLDEWTLRLLIAGVFAEVVAVVKIIVENLFPKDGKKDFMEFINKFHDQKDNGKSEQQTE